MGFSVCFKNKLNRFLIYDHFKLILCLEAGCRAPLVCVYGWKYALLARQDVYKRQIDTQANRADMPDADASRWVTPEALAKVIAFLLSDDAAPITGACLPVGGRV